ncbi:sporulation protein Cse60 [Fictibacillus phosphorivorans]|uniref:sporulation protein Cse60 n=1 Tax=Fictibacillus phosphorivorans TaxID=1221500 RepID=UPI00203D2174|nr:sporulation protein Cse60 [Fictibacillus phosphorivorans]MCM3718006.1 sporulation protein Cse60 [Fictibacillus phosphorivorans]MCM3775455.1 sporulation protein Cse60 [Fictibacillus phosphorivorans]
MIQVKVFDEDHEADLEESVNEFLSSIPHEQVIDIKYQIAVCDNVHVENETMFSFSAMIIYKT